MSDLLIEHHCVNITIQNTLNVKAQNELFCKKFITNHQLWEQAQHLPVIIVLSSVY